MAASSSGVLLFAACSDSGNVSDVLGNQPQGGSGSSEPSTGGSETAGEGGAGGSGKSPDASAGEGGTQELPRQPQGGSGPDTSSGGNAGAQPDVGSGGSGDAPPGGAGGQANTNGGSGGGSSSPTGGTGGEPLIPTPITCKPAEGALARLRLTPIASGFGELTYISAVPDDDARLFVLERVGRVHILANGVRVAQPFLDLTARVATANEEGLIGLAFHPRYSENGRLFVQYASIQPGAEGAQRVILSEFTRSAESPDQADPASERVLMVVEQPADIHLGGMLAFGPDGFLYISRGDGGSHDSHELDSWLGKMLRIDVDTTSDAEPYGIPPGNMTGPGVLPEIWNRGWRNPWRFSFDSCTGDIYVGDVGEARREEIDFEPRNTSGRDYGWRSLEGTRCFQETGDAGSAACDPTGLTPPVLEYEHSEFGCSVIGGYVYRGERISALRGTYLYTDFCTGAFGSLRIENGQALDRRDISSDINPGDLSTFTSFGVDNSGELYLVSYLGEVYRIDPD